MKAHPLFALILLGTLSANLVLAEEEMFHRVPTLDKAKAEDLTFLLTFDGFNTRAEVAPGGADSFATKDLDLGLKGVIGFDKRNAYRAMPGETLRFPAKDNFNPHDGTLVCWLNARGYDPADDSADARKRGNIRLVQLEARDGERGITLVLYAFMDTLYFDWTTNPKPYVFGEYTRVLTKLSSIHSGEWHQIVTTWNDTAIALYLDGEKCREHQLPPKKVEQFRSLMPSAAKNAYIGVRAGGWNDKNEVDVAVDDIAIYKRAMTEIEVRNQYLALLKNPGSRKATAFAMKLNGFIDGLEAEFDLSGMPAEEKKRLADEGLDAAYTLTAPDGSTRTGTLKFNKRRATHLFKQVTQSGVWKLEAEIAGSKESVSIERPDMPWIGNGIGEEDIVPELWRDFAVTNRTVTLWNRRYQFGAGPLPTNIVVYGGALLAERPRLLVNGEEPTWQAGETEHKRRHTVFTGTGTVGPAKIAYRTTVAFDGMIQFDWTIDGNPAIDGMRLEWQVKPENARWLMTPEVCERKENPVRFAYPHKMLWLVREKAGGFAFTQPNDANWVYNEGEKLFSADRTTGKCRVDIITRRVERMPDATPYTALFIATPTRPLPQRNRALKWGRGVPGGVKLVHSSGEGLFNSCFTHAPQECDAFTRRYGKAARDSLSVYGAVKSLTVHEPEARYFNKYWERPGAYQYMMNLYTPGADGKLKTAVYAASSACASTLYSDYLVWCDWKLWTHPLGDRFWQSYFDLCGVERCTSEQHGCKYADKFGRKVSTYDVLPLRRLIMRLVALAHRFGKTVILHGQRNYLPFAQGLADYWYPGEQNAGMLLRNLDGYADDVSDAICRTELNRDVLGIGVLHLPALGQACKQKGMDWEKPELWHYTWSMLAKLQLYDIETCESFAAQKPVRKLWDVLERHCLDDAATRCHLFYTQKNVVSSNPNVQVTWYDCCRGEKLFAVVNLTPEAQEATIDVSRLGAFASFKDELHGATVTPAPNGFKVTIPARDMLMISTQR